MPCLECPAGVTALAQEVLLQVPEVQMPFFSAANTKETPSWEFLEKNSRFLLGQKNREVLLSFSRSGGP
jgi:hypothetical protein